MTAPARALALAAALAFGALKVAAQEWGNINAAMMQSLTSSGTVAASYWLPNTPDPATATIGLGVVYEHISGSAGNTTIAVGFFVKQNDIWIFAGRAENIFGHEPRDPYFTQSFAEITTNMPGPDDPRCCPTVPTRWRIDYQTLQASKIN